MDLVLPKSVVLLANRFIQDTLTTYHLPLTTGVAEQLPVLLGHTTRPDSAAEDLHNPSTRSLHLLQ